MKIQEQWLKCPDYLTFLAHADELYFEKHGRGGNGGKDASFILTPLGIEKLFEFRNNNRALKVAIISLAISILAVLISVGFEII